MGFLQALKNLIPKTIETPIDPKIFNDEIAVKTEWTPLKIGGASFSTNRMVKTTEFQLEFKINLGFKLLCCVLISIGFFAIMVAIFKKISPVFPGDWELAIIPGLVFFLVGSGLLYFGTRPISFNRRSRYFLNHKKKVSLEQVHALQILKENVRGNKSSFLSYELNLILKDATRVNVIDHGNYQQIKNESAQLGIFLGVPVWDTVNEPNQPQIKTEF